MDELLSKGTRLHRRYTILRQLGQGDFGTVYKARDDRGIGAHHFVAIKQLPMQMIVDCERQSDLRALLIHPAVPKILNYFMTAQHAYLVEQLIRGSNLEQVLDAHPGFLPEQRVVGWAIQICAALDYLHHHPQYPLVFRDLKPNNLMVTHTDHLYFIDFGLARAYPPGYFDQEPAQFRHLRPGAAIGTKGYAPPEQYRGRATPQSDIYALGATLHQLLTRRDPRREKPFTFNQFPVRSLNPALSPSLEAIVSKALQRRPNQRFQTAKEMQTALENLSSA